MNKADLEKLIAYMPSDAHEIIIKHRENDEIFFTSAMRVSSVVSRAPMPLCYGSGVRYRLRARDCS